MGNKTIYVKDDKLWDRAKRLAGKDGLSAVIQNALAEFVEQKQRLSEGFENYRLSTGFLRDDSGHVGPTEAIAFEGREVASKNLGPARKEDPDAGISSDARFTVYRTPGRKLVLTVNVEGDPAAIYHYAVYDSIRTLAEDPELKAASPVGRAELLDELAYELSEDWAVRIP